MQIELKEEEVERLYSAVEGVCYELEIQFYSTTTSNDKLEELASEMQKHGAILNKLKGE